MPVRSTGDTGTLTSINSLLTTISGKIVTEAGEKSRSREHLSVQEEALEELRKIRVAEELTIDEEIEEVEE